jgi:hexulose-6-phosphate isomerase
VEVKSVCADYFMDRPFLRTTQAERDARLELLRWLVARCAALNVDRIILPFVDASRIETPDDVSTVVSLLSRVMEEADAAGVELHLETSLPPDRFAELLARLPHPRVKANYDSGNSASLGYDVTEEFRAYGARIGSVHIKDRIRGGSTVPLGRGDVDFDALFEGLGEIGYTREFILQVARSAAGDELEWAKRNRAFVEERCAALRR